MFTSNQIQEIINKLKICGVKDTHFNRAQLVNLTDDITIVQNNKNKVVSVQKLLDCFEEYISGGTSGSSVDFFNVSKYGMILSSVTTPVAYTLEGAIAICPDAIKCSGQVITFLNSTDNKWYCFQYTNSNISGWSTISNWNQVFPNVIEEEDPIFTNSPAAQLTQSDVDKLRGVESEAQKNVQADWDETDSDSDAYIKNKPQSFVNVVVPTPTPVLDFGQTTTIATIDNVDVEVEMPPSPTPSPSSAQKLTLTMNSSTLGEYDPFDTNPTTIDIPTVGGEGLAVWPEFSDSDGDKLAEIRYGDLDNNPQSFNIYSNTKKTIPIEEQPVQGCSLWVTPNTYVPNGAIQGTSVIISADKDDYKGGAGDGTYRFKSWTIAKYVQSGNTYNWVTNTVYDNPCKIDTSNCGKIKVTATYEQVAYTLEWLTDWSQCMSSNVGSFPYTYELNKDGVQTYPPTLKEWVYDALTREPISPPLAEPGDPEWNNPITASQLEKLLTGIDSWIDYYDSTTSYTWTVTGQSSLITPAMWYNFLGATIITSLFDNTKIYFVLDEFNSTDNIQYITLFKYVNCDNPLDMHLIEKYAGNPILPNFTEGWLIFAKIPKTVGFIEPNSLGVFLSYALTTNYCISYDTLEKWISRFPTENAFLIQPYVPL